MTTERQPNDMARTLDRGLQVLELLTGRRGGATLAEVADALGVHRTIAHRLLSTLERRHLVRRDSRKVFHLGYHLVRLASYVDQDLRVIAKPILQELAEATGATAHLGVPDNGDVMVLATVEPLGTDVRVAYRTGSVHPLSQGSAGLAILATRPPLPGERAELSTARSVGYAVSHSEVLPMTIGVSAGVTVGDLEASVGVSVFREDDVEAAATQVLLTAARLVSLLS
ncbi:helix-turn-helix domain-containing protein [Streptomyces sp. NPDC051784]|uniref:IclR family transcriptional regulator n=1 Tax=Streptomyces sp. NPDC051784 TaxID=3155805 RepID=UPI00343D9313